MSAEGRSLDAARLTWDPRAQLANVIDSLWAQRTSRARPLLPDAAVELVWSGRGLFVRGADTRPHAVDAFPGRTFVGVRFRPGAAADILGLRGSELRDARVGISELWGRGEMERLESELAACRHPAAAAAILEEAVAARVHEGPDPIVRVVVSTLAARRGPVPISTLATRLGVSERQLLRRCTTALGYGPKMLDRILRFQRFRWLALRHDDLGLARLAADAGYADQPHLTRECVQLAGTTPATFIASLCSRPFSSRRRNPSRSTVAP